MTSPQKTAFHHINTFLKLQACLKDMKVWMTCNFLLLNSSKTEIIFFVPKQFRNSMPSHLISLDSMGFTSSTTVRNLGVNFNHNLSFKPHIKVTRVAFFHLRNISKIRNILSHSEAEKN